MGEPSGPRLLLTRPGDFVPAGLPSLSSFSSQPSRLEQWHPTPEFAFAAWAPLPSSRQARLLLDVRTRERSDARFASTPERPGPSAPAVPASLTVPDWRNTPK